MTAELAKAIADEAEITSVLELILKSAEEGKYKCYFNYVLLSETIESLKVLGYKATLSGPSKYNLCETEVSWK